MDVDGDDDVDAGDGPLLGEWLEAPSAADRGPEALDDCDAERSAGPDVGVAAAAPQLRPDAGMGAALRVSPKIRVRLERSRRVFGVADPSVEWPAPPPADGKYGCGTVSTVCCSTVLPCSAANGQAIRLLKARNGLQRGQVVSPDTCAS
jgi:hypothetical protein